MRVLVALLALFAAAGTAWAGSPLVSELQTFATHYHENPQKLDELKAGLEKAALADPDVEPLLALSWACFLYGDLRATTVDDKLAAYDRGRQAAKQAIALAPKSGRAQFWYGANTGRWGQTKGVMRALFLLPTVKEAMETALALDPGYAPTYSLAGSIYYEVPGFVGGDLDRSEAMFRKGLEIDPHYTTMRVGLARTLLKKGRTSDARRELEAVLAETSPSNPADWTIKDALQAKALVAHIKERSYRPADSSKKEWAAGQCAARHQEAFLTPGRPRVAIGGIIRTLVRHAPSSRITSLAAVAAERHDPFRVQGMERFECVDWDKGFRWDLEVHDLRPSLRARVSRVRRSLWRRKVTGLVVKLAVNGAKLVANPVSVEPASDGRAIPKKGETVWVVLNDEGGIDRLWLISFSR